MGMEAENVVAPEPRIFVNIASYRDTECQWTVKDLFEKAADPDRIVVGVCWQYVPGDDDDCFQIETRPEQCRIDKIHAKESRGVCWARMRTQALWRDEEYTLQIDSHMRFVPEWDRVLLDMLAECPSEKAILSSYPIPYEPPDKLSDDAVVTIKAKHFNANRVLAFTSAARPIKDAPASPEPSAFCAAGFLFGPSQIITDVPYDPHIYFQGEEITLAVRLWTHGWDIFSPNKVVIYHDYTNRADRIRHWKDEVDWVKINQRSLARVRHFLGIEKTDDAEALMELEKYGLGEQRDLAAYEAFSGITFGDQCIDGEPAFQEEDQEEIPEGKRRPHVFNIIWEQNAWGNAESRSGPGSSLQQTEHIRQRLPEVFRFLDIEILADASCGDFNWLCEISGDLQIYMGFDIVPGLIKDLREKHVDRKNHFFTVADIVTDVLPRCDAIFSRDCLTHLMLEESQRALQRFKESGTTFLIATTHANGQNAEIKTGGWHPMDLTAAPFNLPQPIISIDEQLQGSKKALGIWRLADIPSFDVTP